MLIRAGAAITAFVDAKMFVDGDGLHVHRRELGPFSLFEVSPDEMVLFEAMVREEANSERSLFPFTLVVSKMPLEAKQKIVELMREISLSDNELHEFEINLVARTAELLGIDLDN